MPGVTVTQKNHWRDRIAARIDRRIEVISAMARRQAVHEERVLVASPLGREVLKLRIERKHLLDVIWLATSSI
jgi:hypothetical protein